VTYLLLGTAGCHLCEQAETLVDACISADVRVELVDIAEQTHWQADFATLIPVFLHMPSRHYLNWPFSQDDITTFVKDHD
jgi:Glutaredoxin-like domain (DUF836)